MNLHRRTLGLVALAITLLGGCASQVSLSDQGRPPVVFVHGNGDSAALWQATVWRFESNGWPTDRLHAIDVPYPLARDADNKAQAGRTSTAEHMAFLRDEVQAVMRRTGAQQVVLVGNSRGGNAIRNFICNGGGAAVVSHAILGGTPNHGVQAIPGVNEANEFSGTGPFLKQLNAPKNAQGDEVCGPTRWMTIRSDNNDKFAQPDGLWLGMKGKPTLVGFDGPELKGATNVVIPKIDHRETSYSVPAFEATYRFITGRTPQTAVARQAQVVLSGKLVGMGVDPLDATTGNFVNNLPLRGARLEVYETKADTGQRLGAAAHTQTVGADGIWGPFKARGDATYEFVIQAAGYATTHIYRSAFPRSSQWIHMRPERANDADKAAPAVLSFVRPRGYFDPGRDAMSLDGQSTLPGVPPGAGTAASRLRMNDATQRSVAGVFNGEKVVGQTWPMAQGHTTVLELTD
ncbi:alpha/beta fold hydrolase [Limnohabitans lacus]|uniref:Twin-arginine translocation pathway signal n=1 Tax=Limnohabitans lacus TaxID=3045173 RepID=A0ABT6X6D8_9BURK|nr:alpha/beta fold hydrolase [Limnohabitans sp. HM2-2]MDI9233692.1 twin-arginine translocation pathway signal [Limnohabitans sp. HM2-2]